MERPFCLFAGTYRRLLVRALRALPFARPVPPSDVLASAPTRVMYLGKPVVAHVSSQFTDDAPLLLLPGEAAFPLCRNASHAGVWLCSSADDASLSPAPLLAAHRVRQQRAVRGHGSLTPGGRSRSASRGLDDAGTPSALRLAPGGARILSGVWVRAGDFHKASDGGANQPTPTLSSDAAAEVRGGRPCAACLCSALLPLHFTRPPHSPHHPPELRNQLERREITDC